MAASKKGTAVTAQKVNLPANWEDEMKRAAQRYAGSEAATGGAQYLSIKGGVLKFDGQPIKNNEFECIVLEAAFENALYLGKFNPDSPQPPVCFAFGQATEDGSEPDMTPHKDSHEKQADACSGCPMNEYGTADEGKGKACKNGRRLALLHADHAKRGEALKAPMVFMKVPPTSLRNWASYVKQVANVLGRPPFAVVTRIKVAPHDKFQVEVKFEPVAEVKDREVMAELFARHQGAYKELAVPYQWTEQEAARKPAKKAAKKAGGRKY